MLAAFLLHQLQPLCLPNIQLQPNHHLMKLQTKTNRENNRQTDAFAYALLLKKVPENMIDSYSLLSTSPGC